MYKRIFAFFLLVTLAVPGLAHAQRQQNVTFESIQIDLWPEYDRQAMLVIYRAEIAPDAELPVNLSIRIPASAGEPNAVAVRPPEGVPLNTEYERQVLGEWAYINLTATFPEVQIEYYDPNLTLDGAAREFTFNWPGDYAVETVIMLVQQPTGAVNMSTMPRLSAVTQDSFGLIYLGGEIGAVAEGETFTLTVAYEKETSDLTVNFLQVESSAPVADDTPGRMSLTSALPWVMGLVGLGVIGIGVYWYWSTGRRMQRASRRPAPKKAGNGRARVLEPELREPISEEASIFCHQCGKRANQGDKFCRSCGTKLKT